MKKLSWVSLIFIILWGLLVIIGCGGGGESGGESENNNSDSANGSAPVINYFKLYRGFC